jgi:hypothetical protein
MSARFEGVFRAWEGLAALPVKAAYVAMLPNFKR